MVYFNSIFQAKVEDGKIGKSYARQENNIRKEWRSMPPRPCTVITQDMIDEDVAAFAAHKRRISDYLLEGGWHDVIDGVWTFHDGPASAPTSSTLVPMHFR